MGFPPPAQLGSVLGALAYPPSAPAASCVDGGLCSSCGSLTVAGTCHMDSFDLSISGASNGHHFSLCYRQATKAQRGQLTCLVPHSVPTASEGICSAFPESPLYLLVGTETPASYSLDSAETEGVDPGEVRAESFRSWRHTKVTQVTRTRPGVPTGFFFSMARTFESCVGRVTLTAWDCPIGRVPGAGQPETCLRVLGRGHGRGHSSALPTQNDDTDNTLCVCGGTAWRPRLR